MRKIILISLFIALIVSAYPSKLKKIDDAYDKADKNSRVMKYFNIVKDDFVLTGEVNIENDEVFRFTGEITLRDQTADTMVLEKLIKSLMDGGNIIPRETVKVTVKAKRGLILKVEGNELAKKRKVKYFIFSIPTDSFSKEITLSRGDFKITEINFQVEKVIEGKKGIISFVDKEALDIPLNSERTASFKIDLNDELKAEKVEIVFSNLDEKGNNAFIKAFNDYDFIEHEGVNELRITFNMKRVGEAGITKKFVFTQQTDPNKEQAQIELKDLNENSSIEELLDNLEDQPKSVTRNNAIVHILTIKDKNEVIPKIIEKINDKNYRSPGYAAWGLSLVIEENGDVEGDKGMKLLCSLLKYKDSYVRLLSISGLRNVKSKHTVLAIINTYNEDISNYRLTLAEITGKVVDSKEDALKWWEKNGAYYPEQY